MKLAYMHERKIKMPATIAKFIPGISIFIYFMRSSSESMKLYL